MRYRINQVKLNLEEYVRAVNSENKEREIEAILKRKIEKKVGTNVSNVRLIKESFDSRQKPEIFAVYTADFDANKRLKLDEAKVVSYKIPSLDEGVLDNLKEGDRPVIIGFGPCGMFAGLVLARAGLRPIIFERGSDCDVRTQAVKAFWDGGKLDPNTNVQFGEGGAGTFSDGKLNTGIKDERIKFVLEEFYKHGAPIEITYRAKPHVGTDYLVTVVKNIREEIRALGGEVRFNELVTDVDIKDNCVVSVKTNKEVIKTSAVVSSIGHSARDTFKWMHEKGILMVQKQFSMGVRIEHPQDLIDISQYGKTARELGLPVADYKLSTRVRDDRGVYTFCMCPGGVVVNASSEEGRAVTNGMSYNKRDSGKANSALLVDVRTEDFGSDDVLAGVALQRKYEELAYKNRDLSLGIVKSTWGAVKTENAPNVKESLPDFVYESLKEALPVFGGKIAGFDSDDAVIYAIESRSSSPVRFLRDQSLCAQNEEGKITGLYPAGEGAGYAGGITSAAVDGIKVAEAIIKYFGEQ